MGEAGEGVRGGQRARAAVGVAAAGLRPRSVKPDWGLPPPLSPLTIPAERPATADRSPHDDPAEMSRGPAMQGEPQPSASRSLPAPPSGPPNTWPIARAPPPPPPPLPAAPEPLPEPTLLAALPAPLPTAPLPEPLLLLVTPTPRANASPIARRTAANACTGACTCACTGTSTCAAGDRGCCGGRHSGRECRRVHAGVGHGHGHRDVRRRVRHDRPPRQRAAREERALDESHTCSPRQRTGEAHNGRHRHGPQPRGRHPPAPAPNSPSRAGRGVAEGVHLGVDRGWAREGRRAGPRRRGRPRWSPTAQRS